MSDINPSSLTVEQLLALTIYGEARGEPLEGQVAVANVIKNRVGINGDYRNVILKPKQFSCWNVNDKNYPKLKEMIHDLHSYGMFALKSDFAFMRCYMIATLTLEGLLKDNTGGAKDYMTTTEFNSEERPSWAKFPLNDPTIIGNHTFFNV